MNNNGLINVMDAQVAFDLANAKYGADYSEYPLLSEGWSLDQLKLVADVNGKDDIDAADARAIQYYVHNETFGF